MTPRRLQLRCPACGDTSVCGPVELLARIRAAGMLRKEAEPPWETVVALLPSAMQRMTCGGCGSSGLEGSEVDEDDFDEWGQGRLCTACRAPIPAERLEVFPDATRCVQCQDLPEEEAAEYCPRCGTVMQLRTASRGVTRYQLVCPECRR